MNVSSPLSRLYMGRFRLSYAKGVLSLSWEECQQTRSIYSSCSDTVYLLMTKLLFIVSRMMLIKVDEVVVDEQLQYGKNVMKFIDGSVIWRELLII